MSQIKQPNMLEKVTGNVATEGALTLVGALSGNPLAALLPVLTKSLASERQRKHVEEALSNINETLQNHEHILRNITDEQYKLINETILALFQTTNPAKIDYLRRAVNNTLKMEDILPQESVVLSRIIRDMSADEIEFVSKYYRYNRIQVMTRNERDLVATDVDGNKITVLTVPPNSSDNLIVNGLLSLGVLQQGEPTWASTDRLQFSSIVVKLLVLLKKDPQS